MSREWKFGILAIVLVAISIGAVGWMNNHDFVSIQALRSSLDGQNIIYDFDLVNDNNHYTSSISVVFNKSDESYKVIGNGSTTLHRANVSLLNGYSGKVIGFFIDGTKYISHIDNVEYRK